MIGAAHLARETLTHGFGQVGEAVFIGTTQNSSRLIYNDNVVVFKNNFDVLFSSGRETYIVRKTIDDRLCFGAVHMEEDVIRSLLHKENKETDGKPMELELSWICEASKWRHAPVPKDTVTAAKEWANTQLEEEEDDDEEEEEAMEEG